MKTSLIIGITGGPGMGKTTVGQIMEEYGIYVIDADQLARELTQPGMPAWHEIRKIFGEEFFFESGELNRAALAKLVFQDKVARQQLEEILHPKIRHTWRSKISEYLTSGVGPVAVLIPLLYETNSETDVEVVICVACNKMTQIERLLQRGWTEEEIRLRVAAQLPIEEKIYRADYVIWTEGKIEVTKMQVQKILRYLDLI